MMVLAVYQGPGQMPDWAHPLVVIGAVAILVWLVALWARTGKGGGQ